MRVSPGKKPSAGRRVGASLRDVERQTWLVVSIMVQASMAGCFHSHGGSPKWLLVDTPISGNHQNGMRIPDGCGCFFRRMAQAPVADLVTYLNEKI